MRVGLKYAKKLYKYMLTDKQINKLRQAFNGTNQRAIFKILGDTNRYRIFEILRSFSELTVSEIAKVLRISTPLASQHLKILEQGKILKKEKQGQMVFYRLNTENIFAQSLSESII